MDVLRDDPAARREKLQRWAAEQRWGPGSGPSRTELARTRMRWRLSVARATVARDSKRLADRFLDRGLDTSDVSFEPVHEHSDNNPYIPSSWYVLPRALRYLGVSEHDTFIDFGCGKGRVVHQAAKRPFRRVIGVEISPALAEAARTGLAARRHQHRCRNVEIIVADVTNYRVPDDFTVGYLFHPFTGETFEALLRGIIDSIDRHPRRVRLIYVLPAHGSRILDTGRFRLLTEQRRWLLRTGRYPTAIFESV